MVGKRNEKIFICVDRIDQWQVTNQQPTAWASNSGEEKDSLDHSATGHFIYFKEQQTTEQATI